jgi:NAD+ kinase
LPVVRFFRRRFANNGLVQKKVELSMSGKELPKVVVFGDPRKGDVGQAVSEFAEFVKGKARTIASCGIEECTIDMLEQADFAVVFGGDGTIISAARQLSQTRTPVIGVNLGKLGFLAEFSVEELKQYFNDIMGGGARIEKRMMLGCRVFRAGKELFSSAAVNDVFITAGPPFRMIELKICVDEQELAGCFSDGLIICTPTGSTAYNLSAGGPIVSGKIEGMVVTPICPHSLSFRPIVVNADSRVEVVGVQLNEGTTIAIDGQIHSKMLLGDCVKIEKGSNVVLLVNNPVRNYWETLATKLNWAEMPNYKTGEDRKRART